MLGKLLAAGLALLTFVGGYMVGIRGQQEVDSLDAEITAVSAERDQATERIRQLETTLDLVKRQLQTDRIAYDNLQRSVDDSERQRILLQEKLDAQRALLERLREKIEGSQ